jgi:vacuolar-type H+-ATPase subunit E/Vma4
VSTSIGMETGLIEKTVEKRNKILADAEKRAEEILQAAEAERARINMETDRQILQLMGTELKTVRARIIGQTELEGRKVLMTARAEMLSKVYSQVENRLKDVVEVKSEDHDYGVILNKLIKEGVLAIGGNEFIVSANKRDMEYLRKNLKKIGGTLEGMTLKLDKKPVEILGGVVIRNPMGDKVYYNTLEGRLERVRRIMEARIAEKLGVI